MADFLSEAEKVAVTAAKEAGKVLLKHYRQNLTIMVKGNNPKDVVTNADREADKVIGEILTAGFPDLKVISEENDVRESANEPVWYIDPIDGTTNYSRGSSYFCVSIALAKGKELLVGVIYDPLTSELYTAAKGRGAFMNGKRINVSETGELQQAIIISDLGYIEEKRQTTLSIIGALRAAKGIRLKGSGALAMCEIASGHAEGYIHIGSKPWDYSAATLILREAGGTVTDLDGTDWFPDVTEGIIASNKALSRELLEDVRGMLG
ncbi:inositol monophosphatase [Candidatus Woesearchaeota archaeon]|nr:inositol monophosphatase [Candidatus Woesearchaeota archaeon]